MSVVALSCSATGSVSLRWYIMTSIVTHHPTQAFFAANNYFGLPKEEIFFFQQGELPALTNDGQIIMDSKFKVSNDRLDSTLLCPL